MAEIVIMDFSGIYKGEQFFEGKRYPGWMSGKFPEQTAIVTTKRRRRFWKSWRNFQREEFILLIPAIIII